MTHLGKGRYRIAFERPIRIDPALFLLTLSVRIHILSEDGSASSATAVEGQKEALLDWLKCVEGMTEAALQAYEEFMTD